MTNMMKKKIDERLSYDYNLLKNQFEVLGVFVQGSQNYKLDYENSDIDTKAIVLPKFENICLNEKPVSFTLNELDGSQCDVKDIREMFKIFLKQNVNYIEILFSDYILINPKYQDYFNLILKNKEKIANYNSILMVKSIAGMSLEKLKALEHPYPAWKEHIEKYGFSNKQLHHIIRLNEFIKRYVNKEKFADCLISNNKQELIRIKRNPNCFSLEEARNLANKFNEETWQIKDNYIKCNNEKIDREIEKLFSFVLIQILKIYYKEVLS